MKIYVQCLFLLFCLLGADNQAFSQTSSLFQDPLKDRVDMAQFDDPFAFIIKYQEAPHPAGKPGLKAFLRKQKLEAQKQTPLKPYNAPPSRELIPAPEILASFSGNSIISGTPLDNHLSVGPNEQPVSVINTHMLVTNNTGFWLGSYQLEDFFASVGAVPWFFDPRVIYDPEQDRFILVLINGYICDDSQIVLAFSTTNNPRGSYNLYALDGCLDDDGTFADYPMIAITETELFLTYNEVHSDSTWQAGFMGTQIHQINKMNGYNGENLNRRVWRDIDFNGRLLRNICPVRNADEDLPQSMFLVSTRNFDISNDTVFVLHLNGQHDDPNASLSVGYRVMSQPYGVPPYAAQIKDSLDTNDGRVLDAFLLNGQIQLVSNTMDFSTGRSAVYHGFFQTSELATTGIANIVAHPTDYLGYPGLAWTGHNPAEQDAIIVMSHASPSRHPGGSAVYSDGLGSYSDFVSIIEGTRPVDMLNGPIERWGDYVGIQRLYHQPGSVWISCSYGRQGNVNEAWMAKLARVEEMVATEDPEKQNITFKTYPNPTDEYVTMDIENPDGKKLNVSLYDAGGNPVKIFFDGIPQYAGKASLHFSMHALAPGMYFVSITIDGREVVSRQIVRS